MSQPQKNPERPVHMTSDVGKQPAINKGMKRTRNMLADTTNFEAQDSDHNSKEKKRRVVNDEDKENISPEKLALSSQDSQVSAIRIRKKLEAVSFTSQEAGAEIRTKKAYQGTQSQPIFPCDIKTCGKDGHLFPIEYLPKLTLTLFSNERKSSDLFPDPNYFQLQADIKVWMRAKLYIWLTEVHLKFGLREVVLWASFQICDRFLSKVEIPSEKLQLVGCTSMWIACKYHEIYPPIASDMIKISNNNFTRSDILAMESKICDNLSFQFSIPNAFQFLERFTDVAIDSIKELRLKNRVKYLARYGMERFHLNIKALRYCPSMLAAGSLCAALMLTSHTWTKSCVAVSGYTVNELVQERKDQSLFYQIKKVVMIFDSTSQQAIIAKYKDPKRGRVSMLRRKKEISPSA